MKTTYRYTKVRFQPPTEQGTFENVGIIVQSDNEVACRFLLTGERDLNFDNDNYERWAKFFTQEVEGEDSALRPPRTSVDFFHYLQNRCFGLSYDLTRIMTILDDAPIAMVVDRLFDELVAPPFPMCGGA